MEEEKKMKKLNSRTRNILFMVVNILSGVLWIYLGREQIRAWRLINESTPRTPYIYIALGVIQLVIAVTYLKDTIQEKDGTE